MDDKDDKKPVTVTGRIIDTDAEWKRLMQTANDQMRTVTGRMTDEERKALKQARFLELYGTPGPIAVIHTPNGPDDGQRIRDLFNAQEPGPWHLIQMDWPPGDMPNFHEVPLGEPMVCTLGIDTPEYWGISREDWAKRLETMDFSDLEARIASVRPEGPPISILDGQFKGADLSLGSGEYWRNVMTLGGFKLYEHQIEALRNLDEAVARERVTIAGRRVGQSFGRLGRAMAEAALSVGHWGTMAEQLEPSPVAVKPTDFRDLGHPNERRRFGNNKSLTNTVKARLAKKLAKKSKQKNRK